MRPAARCLAAALAPLLLPTLAAAQAPDENRARADVLFREGQQLLNAGQVAIACTNLEESQRLDPKLGRLLNVAYCHDRLGRTATAWAEYNQAAALALQTAQAERESFARGRAAELAAKVSFLRLDLSAAPEIAQVTVDGRMLTRDQCAVPFPIDPGEHALRFEAPGRKPRPQSVAIATAGTTKVSVEPLEPADAPEPAFAPAAPLSAPAPPARAPAEAAAPAPSGGRRTLGWIIGGAGVAALGVGTGLGLHAMSLRNEADPACPNKLCTARGTSLIGDATTFANIATAGFAIGAVGVAVGAWFVLRPPAGGPPRAQVAPYVGSDQAGVSFGGAW